MIPLRIRADLPGDVRWVVGEIGGQVVVWIADDVPPDSALEQEYVLQATRAWRHRYDRLLPLPLIPAAWKLKHPVVTAGMAVAVAAGGLGLAVASLDPGQPHHRPPVAQAPRSPAPRTSTPVPARPPVRHPAPKAAAQPELLEADVVAESRQRAVVRDAPSVRVSVPPVRVSVPVPRSPVPVPVTPAACRLQVRVGQLVRICL